MITTRESLLFRSRSFKAVCVMVYASAFFVSASLVSAQSVPSTKSGIEIAPAFIEINLNHVDSSKEITLKLTNHSDESVRLKMFPIDFKQSDEQGKLTFFANNSGTFSYSLSSFLSFEADQLILGPKEAKSFTVLVKNRPDLSPGGHYAAIVAALADDERSSDTKISPAVSSLILLRKVGGEHFNLSLKDVDWPGNFFVWSYPRTIEMVFQNEGNIHMVPYGRSEVHDIFGRLLYKGIINTSSTRVFPESRRRIEVEMKELQKGFPVSVNILQVSGNDSLSKSTYAYREYFVYVNPLAVGTLAVIISVGITVWQRKKRYT